MNLFVVFLIIILALAGIGTIWYISKPKCVLPALDKNTCPEQKDGKYQKVPVCDPSTDQLVCTDSTALCGATTVTGQYCDFIKKQWVSNSGGGGGGGGGGGTTQCVADSTGKLPYQIYYSTSGHSIEYTPTTNSLVYNKISFGATNACQLVSCEDGYGVSDPNHEPESTCIKNELRYGSTCYDIEKTDQFPITGGRKTYPDPGASWRNYYDKDGKRYCQFVSCNSGEDSNDPCTGSADCTPTTTDPDAQNVQVWQRNPKNQGACEAITCKDPIHYKIKNPPTGCQLTSCDSDTTFTYAISGGVCKPNGCVPKADGFTPKFTDGNPPTCNADCNDISTVTHFLLGKVDPTVTWLKAQNPDGDLTSCVPARNGSSDMWGGCGDPGSHPEYSITLDGKMCAGTTATTFARFSDPKNTLGDTPGCLQCTTKRLCPSWVNATTAGLDSICAKTSEAGCTISSGMSRDGSRQLSEIDACLEDHSDDVKPGYGYKWGSLQTNMIDGITKAQTTGYPLVSGGSALVTLSTIRPSDGGFDLIYWLADGSHTVSGSFEYGPDTTITTVNISGAASWYEVNQPVVQYDFTALWNYITNLYIDHTVHLQYYNPGEQNNVKVFLSNGTSIDSTQIPGFRVKCISSC
jgi:hypothetical protein